MSGSFASDGGCEETPPLMMPQGSGEEVWEFEESAARRGRRADRRDVWDGEARQDEMLRRSGAERKFVLPHREAV
jgi:hypothetical protein